MSTRRQFIGTLGRLLGAGGVVLPLAGKGAVALDGDLGPAAGLRLTAAPMQFSAGCLQMREIRRALAALPVNSDIGYPGFKGPWHQMMTEEYRPAERRLCAQPAASWADCVALAETIWAFWSKQERDRLSTNSRDFNIYHQRAPISALVEGVLTLGGGERFDPRHDARGGIMPREHVT